jgi:hypothetical protein
LRKIVKVGKNRRIRVSEKDIDLDTRDESNQLYRIERWRHGQGTWARAKGANKVTLTLSMPTSPRRESRQESISAIVSRAKTRAKHQAICLLGCPPRARRPHRSIRPIRQVVEHAVSKPHTVTDR